ncbi:hypothetical protein SAMN04488128_1011174 [Chitinophaga eiseniae]|uniref:Uncharacterized protein n=1 Tax=Chitinophaga eiseniae TaxID=634771 RepID=A0A1T4MMP4_9BACT|nr:hypothetical protein [Chitinophaga eiseniae]SJZ68096.1 hypothetical protein SAMN04488128_1011174 [Chitinophaga eiseniae]
MPTRRKKLIQRCTHFMKINSDKVPPFMMEGNYAFLEEIPISSFMEVTSDIFMLGYNNGGKLFFAGRRSNGILWTCDIRTGKPIKAPTEDAKALYRVKLICDSEEDIPSHLQLLRDQNI